MDKLSIFKSIISGSRMILVSATASLSGTASYAVSSSYAINASGLWSSSSFTASAQSIAAFDTNGKPIFLTPTTNNTYIAIQDGAIVWIPITTAGGTGNFATYAEIFSDNEYLFVQSGSNFAFPSSSFTSDEDMVLVQASLNFAIPSSSFSSDEDIIDIQSGSNFAFPSSSLASDEFISDANSIELTGSMGPNALIADTLVIYEPSTVVTGSMTNSNYFETLEVYERLVNISASMESIGFFGPDASDTLEFPVNISSSMESRLIIGAVEYIGTVISVTSSLLPRFTAPSYTTASV